MARTITYEGQVWTAERTGVGRVELLPAPAHQTGVAFTRQAGGAPVFASVSVPSDQFDAVTDAALIDVLAMALRSADG